MGLYKKYVGNIYIFLNNCYNIQWYKFCKLEKMIHFLINIIIFY